MMTLETVAAQLPDLIGCFGAMGFALGAFVTLVISGLCSAFHTFKNLIGKE